jgi:Flp pilus assembly protein TadG
MHRRRNGGQAILVVIAAMSLFLIGALGLAIDGAQMYAHRQMAQTAADAAAQAAMMSISGGTNSTSAYPFGTGASPASFTCSVTDGRTPCVYARDNGFGGTTADTVTVSFPATVPGVTLPSVSAPAVSVTVVRTLKTGLIRFLGPATSSITAKGTAALVSTVSPSCVFALDSSAQNAFQATNGTTVIVNGCSITVNSTNSVAATINGSSTVTATAIDVVGGIVVNGGGVANPTPTTGTTPVADPFASVPAPAVGACNYTNYNPGFGTWTLNPGVYCGGITISNSSTAIFNAGTYIIKGGGINFTGGSSVTGSGVMFYLTGTNTSYASVTIANGVNVTLSAKPSGTYMGILFFQDRSITSSSNASFAGGASMRLSGSLYFPTTALNYSNGSGSVTYNTGLVAKQIVFTGGANANLTYDPTGQNTGLFTTTVALVQ